MAPKDLNLLDEILNYCKDIPLAIDEYSVDYDKFVASSSIRAMFAFYVMQIGECANKLSEDFKREHSEIDWIAIRGFRNRIVHGYGGVDELFLWDAIQNDVPELRVHCQQILSREDAA